MNGIDNIYFELERRNREHDEYMNSFCPSCGKQNSKFYDEKLEMTFCQHCMEIWEGDVT